MDNPDTPCETVLSDDLLLDYLHAVRKKTLAYLDSLTDDELTTVPKTANTRVLNLSSCSFATFRYTRVCLTGRLSSARAGFLFMWVRPTLPRGFQTGTLRSEGRAAREEASEASGVGVREVCRKKRLPKRGVVVSAEEQAIEKAAADADEGVS